VSKCGASERDVSERGVSECVMSECDRASSTMRPWLNGAVEPW
jgi:hypothetical protein